MPEIDPITLIDVDKRYGRKHVHRGLDLKVPRGSVTALLGRNGAGKSTLLQMLTGLMPRDGGEIRVLGMDPWREPVRVKASVGYVAETTAFHPKWRVRDAIDLVRSLRKDRWDRKEEWRLIDAFELPLGEKIGKLSKGYRAKLALLLALCHRPEVLLLDEPASGLDPIVKREVLGSIVDTIIEEGRTVLLSSHQMEDVERLADRVAFLSNGKIVLEGETEEIRGRARRLAVGPIESDRPLTDLPGDPFVARRGREAVLTYVNGTNGAGPQLRERFRDVNEIGVNLEDLFVDLLGAPREEVVA